MKKTISLMIVFALVFSLLFGFGSISFVKAGGPTTEEIVQKVLEAKADYLKEKMNLPEVPDEIKQRREELQIPTELIDGVSIPKDVVEAKHITSGNDFIQIALDCPSEPLLKYAAEHGVSIDSDLARSKLDEMKSTHGVLKAKLLSIGVSLTDVHDMYVAYNGITATVKISDITNMYENFGRDHDVQRIYNNDFKKGNIHIERLYKLDLDYSVSLIGADTVWTNPGADGTGMTVGVIDTGVDYTHPDLGSGFGAGFKVSAGYDFGDNDNDPMDCQGHGTHVSGIMAADGTVKGVAPKANIVFGKIVSGCAGFASDIDIARAFDYMADPTNTDSGPEGMHDPVASINMSFGADYGFVDPTAPDQQAIENCIASGITVALSAGNAYWSYLDFGRYPFFPDAASIGSPSVTPNSIAVGASWNEKSRYPALHEYSGPNDYAYTVGSGSPGPVTALGTNSGLGYDYVYCGFGGSASDFPASVSGKIALIQRGTYTFKTKINNAAAAGAIGAIIFNNRSGMVNMNTGSATLPSVFISKIDGEALLALAQAPDGDGTGRVGFPASNYVDVPNAVPNAVDTMVGFSSWGPPPDLSFKPDITAPGGGIWSTVPIAQGSYANYSGTSMSSPHIAACAALVKQVHPTWTPDQVKTALMNTAEILIDPRYGVPYSPHLMGAGRVNVNYALHTDVTVTNNNDAKPYVALGEIPDYKTTPVTFTVTLTNSGSAAVTYDISANAQNVAILMNSSDLGNIITTNPSGSVTVPATGTADVIVTINTTGIADWTGSPYYGWPYLEGFVVFTPTPGTELHIPYMGFLGKWNQFEDEYAWDFNPVMDPAADDPMSFMTYIFNFPVTWPWVTGGPYGYFLAGIDFYGQLDRNAIAFNPNAAYLEADIALLRNAQNLNISIKNSSGGSLVKTIDSVDQLPKNPYDWYGWYWYYDNPETGMPWLWNGTDEGGLSVSDGKYYLTLTATAPKIFNKASYDAPHVIDFPVSVDRVPPKTAVTATTNSDGSCTLSWIVSDTAPSSGIWGYALVINDDLGSIIMLPPTTTSYTVSSLPEGEHPFRLMAIDNANNVGLGSSPTISVVPEFTTVIAGGVTSAAIYASDPDGDTLTLSVIVAPIPEGAYELKNSVLYFHPKAGDLAKRFVFTVIATDSAGFSDTGTFTVQVNKPQDTTPPELDIPNVDFDTSQVISQGTMLLNLIATDDSGVIARTVVKDNGIVIKDVMGYLSNLNIVLFEGINDIEVTVYDLAGNFTTKSFRVISDTKPPVVKLNIPESVSSNELNITGTIFDTGTGVKEIKINGKAIAVPSSGKINVTCTLTQGKNVITVQATDKAGNVITKTYTVNYTVTPPVTIITLQINNPEITINGIPKTIDEQDSKPIIKNDRTLLPIRILIESLDGNITWNEETRKVTINLNYHTIILTINSNTAVVDGINMQIDPNNSKVTPIIINGRTYLPLRFIVEHLDGVVDWDNDTRTVTMYYWP